MEEVRFPARSQHKGTFRLIAMLLDDNISIPTRKFAFDCLEYGEIEGIFSCVIDVDKFADLFWTKVGQALCSI